MSGTADTICAVVGSDAMRAALEGQTRPPDDVLVHEGPIGERVSAAASGSATWLWLLDDDVAPEPSALEELLAPSGRDHGLPAPVVMASKVTGADGRLHPRGAPWPRTRGEEVIAACRHGLVPLRLAGWGSLLVRRDAVARYGPPRPDFDAGADDLEWMARVLATSHGYLAPRSRATRSGAAPRPSWRQLRDRVRLVASPSWAGEERLWFAFRLAGDAAGDVRSGPRAAVLATLACGVVSGVIAGPPRRRAEEPG